MAISFGKQPSSAQAVSCGTTMMRHFVWINLANMIFLVFVPLSFSRLSFAGASVDFHRTLTVSSAEVVKLDIDVPSGDLRILYGRDGQVSIYAVATTTAETKLDDIFLPSILRVEQNGNQLTIRHASQPHFAEEGIKVFYRIDVPYRTQLISKLERGKQNIAGIMGPVNAITGKGDITAAYISGGLQAEAGTGDLDLQVIGEHVEAKAVRGNISCTRISEGVSAETGDGDITLMVVGPSTAAVKKGTGRIDVGGAKGSFVGSTDGGELHIRAVPHGDWELTSESGSIRIELPPLAKFDLEASTKSGKFQIDREDFARPAPDAHRLLQTLDGGGRAIRVQTESGNIVIR